MDAKELRQKTPQELTAQIAELRTQLSEVQFGVATQQVKKVRDLRRIKRDLARALTVLGQTQTETNV